MQQIRKDIFTDLFVNDVTVMTPGVTDSLGDANSDATQVFKGYLYEHNEKVLNAQGQEVLSGMQIYLRGDDAAAIDIHAKISCGDFKDLPIIARKVYRGRKGARVIGVVYLP